MSSYDHVECRSLPLWSSDFHQIQALLGLELKVDGMPKYSDIAKHPWTFNADKGVRGCLMAFESQSVPRLDSHLLSDPSEICTISTAG